MMTELEKLKAGLPYNFYDAEVAAVKANAVRLCQEYDAIAFDDEAALDAKIRELFGSCAGAVSVQQGFRCDNGQNIHVGKDFLTNYNVTILDIAPVHIGDYCMIGPNTLISTVGHPLNPKGRRDKLAQAKPIHIGNDVWMGGNVTILPGVTIGNNVVIAAGAVVSKDVPDNSLVAGVPAKVIRPLDNNIEN